VIFINIFVRLPISHIDFGCQILENLNIKYLFEYLKFSFISKIFK